MKKYFKILNRVYYDGFELDLSNESSEFKISISVKSYDKKTAENNQKWYIDEKCLVSALSKISPLGCFPPEGTNYTCHRLMANVFAAHNFKLKLCAL